ncbi:MAG: hypothetical protein IE926_14025 [Micrococcales bacterium]|nr:hypothetical protein [Micrococcales bacterium]
MKRQPIDRPPWCGECSEDGRLVDLPNGTAGRCPRCHPTTQPGEKHDPIRSRRRSKRTRTYLTSPNCPVCGAPVVKQHHCRASVLTGIPR